MTNAELIEKLKRLPLDLEVVVIDRTSARVLVPISGPHQARDNGEDVLVIS